MKNTITIGERAINANSEPYLIAEIGLNHNHDLKLARKMIKSARESGADAVKFQAYRTENLVRKSEGVFSLFKSLELSFEELKMCSDMAREEGITFFATAFCHETVDWLEQLDVPCYKIASMDITWLDLISRAARTGKPVILSTGASSLGEIERALGAVMKTGTSSPALLHCISKYPPAPGEMNLQMISRFRELFPCPVGLSDHSPGSTMSVAATALGATIFEKHFTLDKNMDGPDHSISLDPSDFKRLRKDITEAHAAMQDMASERADISIATGGRRSLFTTSSLAKGTILEKKHIAVVRPGTGTAPEYLPLFIGRKTTKALKEGEPLTFDAV
jgi:N,N'-diacetyllegionaminate synthase